MRHRSGLNAPPAACAATRSTRSANRRSVASKRQVFSRGATCGVPFGPYEVIAALGAGGMGEVYRARDTRLHREVALKVLPPAHGAEPEREQRFLREAQAAGALNHPNILVVFDVGIENGIPFIVTELVDGVSLRQHVQRAPLPIRNSSIYWSRLRMALPLRTKSASFTAMSNPKTSW